MDKIPFEDGTLVKAGYVEIDGTKHETVQPEYTGKTPLSAYNLKKMQDNVENAINDGDLVRKIKISGASKQETREGYNLVDFSNPTNKLAPYSFENDILVVSSSYQYANINWNLLDLFKTNAGKTVYFKSKEVDSSNAISPTAQLTITNNGTNSYINLFNTLYTIPTDTSNLTKAEFGIYCNNSSTDTASSITITEPMLVFEENAEKPYEQYGASPSIEYEAPIESVGDNINIFDIENVNGRYNVTRNDNGFITSASSNAITINADASSKPTYEKNLKAGDYTVSFDIVSTTDITLNNFFLLTTTSDSTIQNVAVIKSVTLKANIKTRISGSGKLNADAVKYGFAGYFASNFASGTITISDIKLSKGTKATLYSPYGQGSIGITMGDGTTSQTKALYTQQPFRRNGELADTFIKQNGVCHEKHNIIRKILNGTENWVIQLTNDNVITFRNDGTQFNGIIPAQEDMSNMFANDLTSGGLSKANCFRIANHDNRPKVFFCLPLSSGITTVELWKTKLAELYNAGTPVYVDCQLETPTLIPCTPEQVEILNDIYSAYGEGMTNIICNDEIEPVIEIVKETKETVQSENDKAISALLARVTELEELVASLQNTAVEEGT